MKKMSSAKLATQSLAICTSLRSFNLYDSNTFMTFFYSEIEKVWFVIIKNGNILVDSFQVNKSNILNKINRIYQSSIRKRLFTDASRKVPKNE